MAGIVIVFDFDKTIIDSDSDDRVVLELGATQLFNRLLLTMPWNSLMNEEGAAFTRKNVITAIKSAYAFGCDLKIVSDANNFFVETILKHHGLIDYFSEINKNPSFVDEDGRLRIFPYHDFTSAPHGCSLWPPNMCKPDSSFLLHFPPYIESLIMEQVQSSLLGEGKKQFVYLGDGRGNYCPSLQLWDLISANPLLMKAAILKWSDREGLERGLFQLISTNCRFQPIPMSSHDALPHAPAVPH